MTRGAASGTDGWSVRANYWRGDRALGGRLEVTEERIRFQPHSLERSLGGRDTVEVSFAEVRALSKAPRSLRMPRERLVVRTDKADYFFLVSNLNRVVDRLQSATGLAQTGAVESARLIDRPEDQPDDSPVINIIYSGWAHLASLMILLVFFVAASGADEGRTAWLTGLGLLIALELWQTIRSFRRAARIKARRQAAQRHD